MKNIIILIVISMLALVFCVLAGIQLLGFMACVILNYLDEKNNKPLKALRWELRAEKLGKGVIICSIIGLVIAFINSFVLSVI